MLQIRYTFTDIGIFAGVYYSIYTELKQINVSPVIAGLVSGLISTTLTHPFELIRATTQSDSENKPVKIFQQLRIMANNRQILNGLTPRLFKKPLSNTLALILFEQM